MNVIYDLIFFSKERFGGISRMWMEYFKLLPGSPITPTFLVAPAHNLAQQYLEERRYFGATVVNRDPRGLARKLEMLGFFRTLQLTALGARHRNAVFHSTDYINPLVRKTSLKAVTTIHDMVFWDQADRFDRNIWYWDKRWCTYHALRASDRVITVSQSSKRSIVDRFPWAERKIVVIPHGLDDTVRETPFAERREKRFLFIGGRNPYKNYDLLVRAFAGFAPAFAGWELHVVGENAYTGEAERKRYRELGIEDRVVDHGLVPQDRLVRLIAESAAVVIPSLNEGFNFPLLEALGAGTPVLSSDIPVSREIGDRFARYFPATSVRGLLSEMVELAKAPPPRDHLMAAREHARSFSWRRSFDALNRVYEECLDGRAGP